MPWRGPAVAEHRALLLVSTWQTPFACDVAITRTSAGSSSRPCTSSTSPTWISCHRIWVARWISFGAPDTLSSRPASLAKLLEEPSGRLAESLRWGRGSSMRTQGRLLMMRSSRCRARSAMACRAMETERMMRNGPIVDHGSKTESKRWREAKVPSAMSVITMTK